MNDDRCKALNDWLQKHNAQCLWERNLAGGTIAAWAVLRGVTYRNYEYVRKDGAWVKLGRYADVWRTYCEEHGYCAATVMVKSMPEPNPLQNEVDHLHAKLGERDDIIAVALDRITALEGEVSKWQEGTLAALVRTHTEFQDNTP